MAKTPESSPAEVEAAVDALYQVPLDRFTAERNALAASLKKSGDAAAAQRVKALAKPSLTAWAVNQVWWQDRAAFQAMIAAGNAQRAAHVAWSKGRHNDVRAAAEARQHAVDAAAERAIAALGGPAKISPDARYRIAGTLEAIASSGLPADSSPGRLTEDVQSTGFDALGGIAPASSPQDASERVTAPARPTLVARGSPKVTPPAPLTEAPRSKAQQRAREKAAAEAQARAERLARAEKQLAQAESALAAAERNAAERAVSEERAKASAQEAQARIARLEEELDRARADEREGRRALAQAASAAADAALVRARTAREVAKARELVDSLRKR